MAVPTGQTCLSPDPSFVWILKFNPYHDPVTGRFTSKAGAGKGRATPKATAKALTVTASPKAKAPPPKAKAKAPPPAKAKAPVPAPTPAPTPAPAKPAGTLSHIDALMQAKTPADLEAVLNQIAPPIPAGVTGNEWLTHHRKREAVLQAAEKGVKKALHEGLRSHAHGKTAIEHRSRDPKDKALVEKLQAEADTLIHPGIQAKISKKKLKVFVGSVGSDAAASGAYLRSDHMIQINAKQAKGDEQPVYSHEVGHMLEESVPGLHAAVVKFRKSLEHEQELVSDYAAKDIGGHASEIVSTGLEHYHRNPLEFAKIAPKHFLFIHRLVQEGRF